MKRKSILLIIGLMGFALVGVMAMQYYFIRESYNLKSQLFDQAVNDALNNVSEKLEKKEALQFLTFKVNHVGDDIKKRSTKKPSKHVEKVIQEDVKFTETERKEMQERVEEERKTIIYVNALKASQAKSDSLFRFRDSLLRRNPHKLVYNGPVATELPAPVEYSYKYNLNEVYIEGGAGQRIVTRTLSENPRIVKLLSPKKRPVPVVDSIRTYLIEDPTHGLVMRTIGKANFLADVPEKDLKLANRKRQIEKQANKMVGFIDSVEKSDDKVNIFKDIATELQQVKKPLRSRIEPQTIDSLLAIELANHGINLNYYYKISSSSEDSIIYCTASMANIGFDPNYTYRSALFTKDMVRDGGMLSVTFPEKNNLLLKNMGGILFSSGSLLLIMLGSFAYTIFSILKQKKISEMKTDFINNMTHEFKTPVATIMIASEALKDPEINENQTRVNKLASVIYDENIRLGNHIERVLNIAKIEKNDLKLDCKQIDINELITTVIDSMSLQLQKKQTNILLNLSHQQLIVKADELHLSNVIFNLIDNANKYSKGQPEITISTESLGKQVIIKVRDRGIGMSRDQQKKIFEQFYRIPTGNLHDVKGFGLGLSYVSNMVKRMNGSISVKSEKDKGSEFEIKFPLV